tara:strand:+ start:2759 stop:3316 length:558 start_codon:yes stop_codon:yes gene_type:complete
MGDFKYFLLNENRVFLGERIGDILNSLQELEEESPHMGKRQLIRHADRIVSMIRRIVHSSWPKNEKKHLKHLQKVGVALAKAIDEKGEIADIIGGASSELTELLNKMGSPIHQIGTGKGDEAKDAESQADEPDHKKDKDEKPEQMPQPTAPDMQPQAPTPPEQQSMPQGGAQMPPGIGQQGIPYS